MVDTSSLAGIAAASAGTDSSGTTTGTTTITDTTNSGKIAANAFGITEDLIKAYPELLPVWQLFLADNITDAKLAYYKTSYFENLSTTSKNRAVLKASQSGVYTNQLDAYRLEQKKRLIAAGITLDDATFNALTEESFDKGFTDSQLDLRALSATTNKIGGTSLGAVQSLKEYANSFGMTYQDKDFDSWSRNIFAGTTTAEDMQAKIRQDAASTFPAYADQINKGISIDALASAYKSSMATLLEIDADSISYTDPTLRRALQTIGPDGKPTTKPLWEFEKELRADSRWQYTNNARDTVDGMQYKVLKDWGLM